MKQTLSVGNIPCWCGSNEYTDHSGVWRSVSGTTATLRTCKKCGCSRTFKCEYEPYEENVYINALSLRHQNSLHTIKKYCKGRLLDIGCNCGEILNNLSEEDKFTSLKGIDQNTTAINLGIKSYGCNLEAISPEKLISRGAELYDTITLVHVFEHVLNPTRFLQDLKKLLDKKGHKLIYICVPNIENADIFSFGALDPREHYWHYTESSLNSLIKKAFPFASIILSGKSHIWGYNEQIEIVIKL